ncbi:MAG TPA: TonB family protein [Burkholderiales bacterium]|nr:TonB family protein [Burkholderiales bacterium]
MKKLGWATAILCALVAAGCTLRSQKPETPQSQPEVVPPGPVAKPSPPTSPAKRPTTLDSYKIEVAKRIASASPDLFSDPLPEVLKSIVVLDIAIGRDGVPQQVSVRRSNGFRQLEQRAEASVRKAAPFSAPGPEVLRGASSVRFLETFLFRDDGRFQIRSLVDAS